MQVEAGNGESQVPVQRPGAAAASYTEHFGFVIELQVPAICGQILAEDLDGNPN